MSLRWKTLLAISLTFVAVIAVILAVSELTFMRGFRNVESQNSRQIARQSADSLKHQVEILNTFNHDWAAWDDTYNFVQDPVRYPSYISSNPTDVTFANADLNFLFIVNDSGDVVYSKGYDLVKGMAMQIPDSLDRYIANGPLTDPANRENDEFGIMLIPEGPVMLSSQPILTSEGKGPVAGTIIMARYVGQTDLMNVSSLTGLPVAMLAVNDKNVPAGFQLARSTLSADLQSMAVPINSKSMAAFVLLNSIDGQPAVILETVMPRTIYSEAVNILRYFLLSLIGLAILLAVMFDYIVNKSVIQKLGRMSKYARDVQASGDLSKRLGGGGKDEIGSLKLGINGMVEALQKSQLALQKQEKLEEKLRLTIESVVEGIATTDLDGVVVEANDSKAGLHGFASKQELIGKNAVDLIAPEDRERAREAMRQVLNSEHSGTNEYALLKKDGSKFFGERSTALVRDAEGNPSGFVTSTKDITGRKRVESLLKQSEKKYRLITENMGDMVILLDLNEQVLFVNASFERIRGFSLEDMNRMPPEKNMTSSSWDLHVSTVKAQFTPERLSDSSCVISFTLELQLYRKDGSTLWVEDTNTLVRSEDGTPEGLLIISRDISERKKVEIELQKYELIAGDSRDIVLFLNEGGDILEANAAAVSAYGYGRESLLSMNVREVRTSDSLGDLSEQLEVADSQGILFETVHKRRDGSIFPVEVSSKGAIIGSGRTLINIIRDITERKESEKQKQELQKLLEIQVERMPMALIMLDKDYQIQAWNPAAEKTFGFSSAEVLGKNPNELIVPKNIQRDIDGVWQRLVEGDETAHSINENTTKDGRTITCEWFNTPLKNEVGKTIGVLSMVEDITQERINQEKLARSSREWRTTFDSIKEMVSITDNNSNILRVNKAFADAVHAHPRLIIGKKYDEVIRGLGTNLPHSPAVRTVIDGNSSILEFDDAQNNIHLEESSSPVHDEDGNVTAVVRVARDITERKKMEDRLVVADRLASIGELVAGVAHELNNPLTTVIGFSDLLLKETDIEVMKEELGIINREARRTSVIVKNLLTFARKHAPVKQPGSINKAMDEVLQLRAYEQKVNNIDVVRNLAPDLSDAMVDYFQIQQVFLNLIVNAEQAMIDANGRGKLTLTTENHGNGIRIIIADDGPGIAPENLSKIFNPFFTTKEVGRGTGLGLSICHGIVTSHGGRIDVKTKQGFGTEFIIELPLNMKTEKAAKPEPVIAA